MGTTPHPQERLLGQVGGTGKGVGGRKRQVHKGQEERAEKNSGIQHAGRASYANSERRQHHPQASLHIQSIHLRTG